jgi:hypothetical protein
MSREEIFDTIDEILRAAALTRADFVELGRSGLLTDPELRDLWLIWGLDVAHEVDQDDDRIGAS